MSRCGVPLALIGAIAIASCAHYQPQPITPAAHVVEYRARRLDDPALLDWVAKWAGRVAPGWWTDRQLAVAGLRLRAEIQRAREDWLTARAGERTAGARPASGVSTDVERAVSSSNGQSPWVVSLSGLLTVELGGKRAARIQQARARTTAAEADLILASWQVAHDIRGAAVAVSLADTERTGVSREIAAIESVQELERQRFTEAAVTSSELARTAGDVAAVRVAVAAAERDLVDARAGLAAAVGLTPRAFDAIRIVAATSLACDRLDSLGSDSVQTLALSGRAEIARALAGYAGAEADLRLQVARQFPDLDLGPGFIWDQGVHRWTLALAAPGLLAFRNRGPIAEATANRRAAAARVMAVQETILGELSVAEADCRGARIERIAADSQVAVAERALTRAQAAYERGETGKLDVALASLALTRAEEARRSADRRIAQAGLVVEAATGAWQGEPGNAWPDPRAEPGEKETPR